MHSGQDRFRESTFQAIGYCPDDILYRTSHAAHLPFLLSLHHGRRARLDVELMLKSPVVRQSTLCQSSYFFNVARRAERRAELCNTIPTQYDAASRVLRHALQVLLDSNVALHLHGSVRVMVSIMQLQRFEIAMSSFGNCRTHLDGAVALFEQIMESASDHPSSQYSFEETIMGRLQTSTENDSKLIPYMPSAEQAAFRFATSLLILDDVVSSIITHRQPRLYRYHENLLSLDFYDSAAIELGAVVGVQNAVVQQLGEIAALDDRKTFAKTTGIPDHNLAARAAVIEAILEAEVSRIENAEDPEVTDESEFFKTRRPRYAPHHSDAVSSDLVTLIWAHAALLYLHVVVSGWQPTVDEVEQHIKKIKDMLSWYDKTLVRTTVWPLVVAGCLASRAQESAFRDIVNRAQPSKVYGTVHKALVIMENAWQHRSEWTVDWDLATCFGSQAELVLLV